MATREEIVAEARSWIGTRFHHQARIKGVGVDCINLIIGVGMALDLGESKFNWDDHPEYHGYGKSPNGTLLIEGCERFMKRIDRRDAKPGDILIMKFVEEPQHFVMVTEVDPTYIVHAYAQMRKVVEHRYDEAWRARTVAAYRFHKIDE